MGLEPKVTRKVEEMCNGFLRVLIDDVDDRAAVVQ